AGTEAVGVDTARPAAMAAERPEIEKPVRFRPDERMRVAACRRPESDDGAGRVHRDGTNLIAAERTDVLGSRGRGPEERAHGVVVPEDAAGQHASLVQNLRRHVAAERGNLCETGVLG